MDSILQDLRYAIRTLAKAPGFTATAVLTLALGIGASTSIFSLVDAAMLKPLPFPNPEQLVVLGGVQAPFGNRPSESHMDLLDWRRETAIFQQVAEYGFGGMNLGNTDRPLRLRVAQVTPNFFTTMGVMPALGRPFSDDEGKPGTGDVVMLSDGLWRTAFGSDPNVLGPAILLNDRLHRVVGVMPPGFSFPAQAELWVPFAIPWDQSHSDIYRFVLDEEAIGRMQPGLAPTDAARLAAAASSRYRAAHPRANTRWDTQLVPLRTTLTSDRASGYLLLLATVGVVLLIACANVAGLSIARAAMREHDFALRTALGASRSRLARQLLSETFVLTAGGATLGVFASTWSLRGLASLLPDAMLGLVAPTLDWRVLGATTGLVCAATVVCGLAPLRGVEQSRLAAPLYDSPGRVGGRETNGLRRMLVTAQLALALALVSAGGILVQSLIRMEDVDLGIRPDHVMTADISLPMAKYRSGAQRRVFYEELGTRLGSLPDVRAVGFASGLPLSGDPFDLVDVHPLGADQPDVAPVVHVVVTPGYFESVGQPMLAGRDFDALDDSAGLPVIVITKALADRLGQGRDAIGAVLRVGTPVDTEPRTVIGVVGDAKTRSATDEITPGVYFPFAQQSALDLGTATLAVRTIGDPAAATNLVRRTVASIDPTIPLYKVRTLREIVETSLSVERGLAVSLVSFATAALALAALGLYGVLTYLATRRTREIGIRIALGARRADVLRLVLREGVTTVATGTALGLLLALGASRFLTHFSFGINSTDLTTLVAASTVLGVAALAAAWVPALRATRVDPVVALRTD